MKRLVVELNARSERDLTECVTMEEMNKTTVVNRAVQVYGEITANQRAGGRCVLIRPDGTEERLWIL